MICYQDSTLAIHRLLLNEIKTNCYIVQKGSQAILVDPTDKPQEILDYLETHRLELVSMLATHAHFDHISGAAGVIAGGRADTLYLHEKDLAEVKRAPSYSLMLFKRRMTLPAVAAYSPELLALLSDWGLAIQHGGGHTPGSCILYSNDRNVMITGDLAIHHKLRITLFDSRENSAEFRRFVDYVEAEFRPDTVVLPGHGDPTTVGVELEKNPKWSWLRAQPVA